MNEQLRQELLAMVKVIKNGLDTASEPPTTSEMDDLKTKVAALNTKLAELTPEFEEG